MPTQAKPPRPNKTTLGQIGPKFGNGNGTPSDAPPSGTIGPTPAEVAENAPQIPTGLHRYFLERHSPVWGLIDLTPWVTSCTWTLRVREPWTTINATLAVPFGQKNILPDPNDVIIVRGVDGAARAWGFADSTPDPALVADAQGMTFSPPTAISTVSWLLLMRKAMVFASPGALAGRPEGTLSIGTYFTLSDWTAIATEILGAVQGNLNERMAHLVKMLARLRLPRSLGDAFLGDFVAVVMNAATSATYADGMPCDPILGPSLQSVQTSFPTSTSALDAVIGTLVPDRRLIEFWEDLSPTLNTQATTSSALSALTGVETLALPATAITARKAMNATPFLVYRLAPFRWESLKTYLDENSAKRLQGLSVSALDPSQDDPLLRSYETPSWLPNEGYQIDGKTELYNFQAGRSDSERINAVTVGLPGQPDNPIGFWNDAGLPIMDDADVALNGLRLYRPNWPFFPPASTDIIPYMRITAGLAAMMFLGNQRFYSGSFSLSLRSGVSGHPDLRIGRPCTIRLQTGVFQCYVDQASHSVTVGPKGEVVGRTTVQFSRGLYNDPALREAPARAPVRPSNVPVLPKQPVQKTTQPAQPTSASRVSTKGILFNGAFIPWTAPFPMSLWLLSKDMSGRQKRTQAGINTIVLHYTDGNETSTGAGGARHTFDTQPDVDSHFIIEADGSIVQVVDAAITAYQAGVFAVNVRSIGIDFVTPKLVNRPQRNTALPWNYQTGFDVTTDGAASSASKKFYSPNSLQLEACRALVFWASQKLAVPLVAPAATGNPKTIAWYAGNPPAGVYHHAEIFNGRQDCLGIYIPTDIL